MVSMKDGRHLDFPDTYQLIAVLIGIANATGCDLEAVYNQCKREQDLADSLGLKFGTDIRGQGTLEINSEVDPEENDGSSGEPKNGSEKPAKPTAKTKPAPATPNARELVRGMHPANSALWDLTTVE